MEEKSDKKEGVEKRERWEGEEVKVYGGGERGRV